MPPSMVLSNATDSISKAVTRRTFFRRAGATAFTAGLSAAMVGTVFSELGYAQHGDCRLGPCGPSPICTNGCTSTASCTGNARNQPYASGECGTGGNSWEQRCCPGSDSGWIGVVKCGDCCHTTRFQTAGTCTGCGSTTRYKCICRRVIRPC
jgi:hypothetical protein